MRNATNATSFDEIRSQSLHNAHPENIQAMGKQDLVRLQTSLLLGSEWGRIAIPKEFMPKGQFQRPSKHTVDFAKFLSSKGCPTQSLEQGVLVLTRLALLLTVVPHQGFRGAIHLAPSGLIQTVRNLTHAVALALAKPTELPQVIGRLTADDFVVSSSLSQQRATSLLRALKIVTQFSHRGLWDDGPTYDLLNESKSETSRRGPKTENIEKKTSPFLPFPDEFIAQAGWRLAWASKNLGPNVLELGRQITEVFLRFPYANEGMSNRMVKHWRKRDVELLLGDFQWRTVDGKPIDTLPFELRIIGTGAHDPSIHTWPPRLWTQFQEVFKLIQAANLFIFLLSVGSRISEALSLKPGCVVHHPDGISLADGMTYKISLQLGGEMRDWALPDVTLEALKLQEELVKVAIELGNNSQDPIEFDEENADVLWLQIGSRDPSQGGENAILNRMIEILGLTELLGDTAAHSHRFRKTLARLAALAITGAPKILMDLFGHKTIEMTLHYILSDPLIRSEIADIAKAQTIMFVGDALADIENCGGKAAKTIQPIVAAARARHGRDFGERELHALAELLTLGGTQCQIVREGVLCLKNDLQVGPCAKGIGTPEPSRCCTPCEHRLETQIATRDADNCLSKAVDAYSMEKAQGNEIMQEFWSGQVLTHLPRFEKLKDKWSVHPVVQEIIRANLEAPAI